jgi:hypothetical protein
MKGFGEGVRRMTEKRYVIEEIGNMFRVLKDNEPLTTKFENCDKQDVTNLIVISFSVILLTPSPNPFIQHLLTTNLHHMINQYKFTPAMTLRTSMSIIPID